MVVELFYPLSTVDNCVVAEMRPSQQAICDLSLEGTGFQSDRVVTRRPAPPRGVLVDANISQPAGLHTENIHKYSRFKI